MKTIYMIELVFENCDTALIRSQDVLDFSINNCMNAIQRFGLNTDGFEFKEYLSTDAVQFSFNKKLNYFSKADNQYKSLYERLKKWPDITSIYLHYDDTDHIDMVKEIKIVVPWCESKNKKWIYNNKYQKIYNNYYNTTCTVVIRKPDFFRFLK